MQTTIIMDTGRTAPPAEKHREPNESELRRDLRQAQEVKAAADARAQLAGGAEARARAELTEAQATVQKLERAQKEACDEAVARRAKLLTSAIRAGSPLPSATPAMPPDTASLGPARAQRDALQAALDELIAESNSAKGEADSAAAAVGKAATAVADCVAQGFIGQFRAARDVLFRLEEIVSGYFVRDQNRPGGPKFGAVKEELKRSLDRQADTRANHPELGFETWKMDRHFQALNSASEKRWQDFHRRLCESADARFEGACAPAEQ